MLVVTGPPGAGKSTVSELLAARWERSVHLRADNFFDYIRSGFVEPWRPESQEQNRVVMGIVADVASAYEQAGYSTIVDGILIPGWFWEPVRDHLRAHGIDAALVVLRPALEVCLERVRRREPGRFDDPAVIESMWKQFSGLGELERHVIESGAMDPEAVADAVAARL